GVHGHADQGDGFQGAEEAPQRQPVGGHANPVVVVGRAQNAGNEDQTDDDVQPFFQYFAVGAGQADEQVGQEGALDHFPYAFHPQVDGPPPIIDGDDVIGIVQQGRQIQQGGTAQAQQQHAFRGGEAPGSLDGHADVVQEDQHTDDDEQLVGQGLFQQFVAGTQAEEVGDYGGDAHDGPQDQLDVGQLDAVDLGA